MKNQRKGLHKQTKESPKTQKFKVLSLFGWGTNVFICRGYTRRWLHFQRKTLG
ncbi:MAG: hypothetical protein WBZ11_06725 [Candidatus Sulfotelmatobacter sp.]